MAFVKMITRGDGSEVAEVFVKREELIKVLAQQDVAFEQIQLNYDQYCLTFSHSKLEEYD